MKEELVIVVDRDDNPIITKPRENITDRDIIRVSVLWVEDGHGNVLLQQRSLNKKLGAGQWQTAVAGTVEAHESYLDSVIKETSEEIGLRDFTPTEIRKVYNDSPGGKFGRMIMFYMATCDKPIEEFTVEEGEAEQLRWVDKAELIKDVDSNPEKYVSSATLWKDVYGS